LEKATKEGESPVTENRGHCRGAQFLHLVQQAQVKQLLLQQSSSQPLHLHVQVVTHSQVGQQQLTHKLLLSPLVLPKLLLN
jgi:hypothetical protein